MKSFIRAFAFVLCLYVINALPVEEQQQDAQIDLVAVESVPDVAVETADSTDLTRTKRQCEFHTEQNALRKKERNDCEEKNLF